MGSEAQVTVLDGGPELVDQARRRLDELEQRWSRFLPDSEISQLNRSDGGPVVVSPETFAVVTAAVEAWRWSGGRFDPTIGRTMELAGYDRPFDTVGLGRSGRHEPAPTPADIVLDPYPESIRVPPGVRLDLGGIGKGAAADLVAAELLMEGAAGCCVNVGGDLRVAGQAPRPEGWRIEVAAGSASGVVTVGVRQGAVCTSTRTRRVWVGADGPEHHLRDPTTGQPLDTGLRTVTVISARAIQAEVLTKTAFAAGRGDAAAVIGRAGATGLLVDDDSQPVLLEGLGPFLEAARPRRSPARAA